MSSNTSPHCNAVSSKLLCWGNRQHLGLGYVWTRATKKLKVFGFSGANDLMHQYLIGCAPSCTDFIPFFFFFTVEGKNRPDWNEQLIVNLHLPVEAIFYFLFFLWSKRHPCTDLQASKPGLTIRFRFAAVVSSKVRAWILRSPDCISAVIVTSTCCRWQQVRRHQIKVLMLWRSCSSLPLKELQIYVAYMSHCLHPWQSNKTSVSVLR